MRCLILVVALLASSACDKSKHVEPKSKLPVIPDAIAAKLGNVETVVAIDFSALDLSRFKQFLPEPMACARELLDSKGTLVAGKGEVVAVYVTKVPEASTRACIEKLAPLIGATVTTKGNVLEVDAGGEQYALQWTDGVLAITEAGAKPSGTLPEPLRAQISRVPVNAGGLIASVGWTERKVKQAVRWFEDSASIFRVIAIIDGSEAGAAKDWLEKMVAGFKAGASEKGLTLDDSWFVITEAKETAKLEAMIPKTLFDSLK